VPLEDHCGRTAADCGRAAAGDRAALRGDGPSEGSGAIDRCPDRVSGLTTTVHRARRRGTVPIAIRVARPISRVLARRGRVWDGRYHAHALRSPHEVRNALVYVLQNFHKHLRRATGFDAYSSARWFSGWRKITAAPLTDAPVVEA